MLRRERPRILAPVNGTSASEHAFRWCCQIARSTRSDLMAVYVYEIPMEYAVESIRGQRDTLEGERILHQVERIASDEHCKVSASMIAARNAGPAIVLEASQKSVGLLVLGLPFDQGSSGPPIGTTSRFILRNAQCQVLISREPDPNRPQRQD